MGKISMRNTLFLCCITGLVGCGGNSSSPAPEVTEQPLLDSTAPTISLNGDNPIKLTLGQSFIDPGALASDNTDGKVPVSTSGTVDPSKDGTYVITYTATDKAGNVSTITRSVEVAPDTVGPMITLNGNESVSIIAGTSYTDAGAKAVDAIDGAVTVVASGNVDASKGGKHIITYTAVDKSGNISTLDREVVVTADSNAPAITILGLDPIDIKFGDVFTDPGASALDTVDGTVTINSTGSVNNRAVGTYTITYTAQDQFNNKATATRTVNVINQADIGGLNQLSMVAFSSDSHLDRKAALEGNYTYSVSRPMSQEATLESTLSFNDRLVIDLGKGDKGTSQANQFNEYGMHLLSGAGDSGFLKLRFKDASNNTLHEFIFDKSGGEDSAYVSFDGTQFNYSEAAKQAGIYGYILVEAGELEFQAEYLLEESINHSGIGKKTWSMEHFEQVSSVEIQLAARNTEIGGFAQLPLVIFHDGELQDIAISEETIKVACLENSGTNCTGATSATSTVTVPSGVCYSGEITDIDVYVDLTHSWIGDLTARFTAPDGQMAELFNRPGYPGSFLGCSRDDIKATFDDSASTSAESQCSGKPAISGTFSPSSPLTPLHSSAAAGEWQLFVGDSKVGNSGRLRDWSVSLKCAKQTLDIKE